MNARLNEAILVNANFSNANLGFADLSWSRAFGAMFNNADMGWVRAYAAEMSDANLQRAGFLLNFQERTSATRIFRRQLLCGPILRRQILRMRSGAIWTRMKFILRRQNTYKRVD